MATSDALTYDTSAFWWRSAVGRAKLLSLPLPAGGLYVYNTDVVKDRAESIVSKMTNLSRVYYAMKANSHPEVVKVAAAAGMSIECVSAAEVEFARDLLGPEIPILFTPNFCPIPEYSVAFEFGCEVTVDGPELLTAAKECFSGKEIAIRIDPNMGDGHHSHVVTSGASQKFGLAVSKLPEFFEAADAIGAKVVGMHTHVGSGIKKSDNWARVAAHLKDVLDSNLRPDGSRLFKDLRWIDIGGGIGVVDRDDESAINLVEVNESLQPVVDAVGGIELRMEPGRFIVSEAGVLLTSVTQIRSKGDHTFVGVSAGMNALIRPALYNSYHGIYNLSRLEEPFSGVLSHVVGPICESGDVVGRDRELPVSQINDVVLVANGGAYGAVMSSSYNMRPCPDEVIIGGLA